MKTAKQVKLRKWQMSPMFLQVDGEFILLDSIYRIRYSGHFVYIDYAGGEFSDIKYDTPGDARIAAADLAYDIEFVKKYRKEI